MMLYMTEIRVADPLRMADWYAEVLGLRIVLWDEPGGFVLMEAPAGGRVALKRGMGTGAGAGRFRLVFLVDDVDAERERLLGLGVAVGEPTENAEEHYREIRLSDPDGNPLTLFAWAGP